MQSDLLLGDQMYHLTLSKVEIPHSENAEVEYYTTYPKTPKKGREPPPQSPVAHAHTIPVISGSTTSNATWAVPKYYSNEINHAN